MNLLNISRMQQKKQADFTDPRTFQQATDALMAELAHPEVYEETGNRLRADSTLALNHICSSIAWLTKDTNEQPACLGIFCPLPSISLALNKPLIMLLEDPANHRPLVREMLQNLRRPAAPIPIMSRLTLNRLFNGPAAVNVLYSLTLNDESLMKAVDDAFAMAVDQRSDDVDLLLNVMQLGMALRPSRKCGLFGADIQAQSAKYLRSLIQAVSASQVPDGLMDRLLPMFERYMEAGDSLNVIMLQAASILIASARGQMLRTKAETVATYFVRCIQKCVQENQNKNERFGMEVVASAVVYQAVFSDKSEVFSQILQMLEQRSLLFVMDNIVKLMGYSTMSAAQFTNLLYSVAKVVTTRIIETDKLPHELVENTITGISNFVIEQEIDSNDQQLSDIKKAILLQIKALNHKQASLLFTKITEFSLNQQIGCNKQLTFAWVLFQLNFPQLLFNLSHAENMEQNIMQLFDCFVSNVKYQNLRFVQTFIMFVLKFKYGEITQILKKLIDHIYNREEVIRSLISIATSLNQLQDKTLVDQLINIVSHIIEQYDIDYCCQRIYDTIPADQRIQMLDKFKDSSNIVFAYALAIDVQLIDKIKQNNTIFNQIMGLRCSKLPIILFLLDDNQIFVGQLNNKYIIQHLAINHFDIFCRYFEKMSIAQQKSCVQYMSNKSELILKNAGQKWYQIFFSNYLDQLLKLNNDIFIDDKLDRKQSDISNIDIEFSSLVFEKTITLLEFTSGLFNILKITLIKNIQSQIDLEIQINNQTTTKKIILEKRNSLKIRREGTIIVINFNNDNIKRYITIFPMKTHISFFSGQCCNLILHKLQIDNFNYMITTGTNQLTTELFRQYVTSLLHENKQPELALELIKRKMMHDTGYQMYQFGVFDFQNYIGQLMSKHEFSKALASIKQIFMPQSRLSIQIVLLSLKQLPFEQKKQLANEVFKQIGSTDLDSINDYFNSQPAPEQVVDFQLLCCYYRTWMSQNIFFSKESTIVVLGSQILQLTSSQVLQLCPRQEELYVPFNFKDAIFTVLLDPIINNYKCTLNSISLAVDDEALISVNSQFPCKEQLFAYIKFSPDLENYCKHLKTQIQALTLNPDRDKQGWRNRAQVVYFQRILLYSLAAKNTRLLPLSEIMNVLADQYYYDSRGMTLLLQLIDVYDEKELHEAFKCPPSEVPQKIADFIVEHENGSVLPNAPTGHNKLSTIMQNHLLMHNKTALLEKVTLLTLKQVIPSDFTEFRLFFMTDDLFDLATQLYYAGGQSVKNYVVSLMADTVTQQSFPQLEPNLITMASQKHILVLGGCQPLRTASVILAKIIKEFESDLGHRVLTKLCAEQFCTESKYFAEIALAKQISGLNLSECERLLVDNVSGGYLKVLKMFALLMQSALSGVTENLVKQLDFTKITVSDLRLCSDIPVFELLQLLKNRNGAKVLQIIICSLKTVQRRAFRFNTTGTEFDEVFVQLQLRSGITTVGVSQYEELECVIEGNTIMAVNGQIVVFGDTNVSECAAGVLQKLNVVSEADDKRRRLTAFLVTCAALAELAGGI